MKKTLLTAIAALSLLLSGWVAASTPYAKQKVVYHVNYFDVKRSIGAMRNAQNHINALGEGNHEIRFVLHGNGVELLRKVSQESTDAANRIDSLRSQSQIQNLRKYTEGPKIKLEDLHFAEQSDVVPSGVAEIGKLQQEGFVYLRP